MLVNHSSSTVPWVRYLGKRSKVQARPQRYCSWATISIPRECQILTTKKGAISEKILETQVNWIRGTGADEIFVPGNHDWLRGKRNGWQQITNQQQWIDSLNDKHITLLPKDGCPGPVEVPLGKNALLVILDTQWFLHPGNKPGDESSCDAKTPAEALLLLNDIFVRNPTKRIILAAHHPLITYGEHGGVFTLKDHLFPFTSLIPSYIFHFL